MKRDEDRLKEREDRKECSEDLLTCDSGQKEMREEASFLPDTPWQRIWFFIPERWIPFVQLARWDRPIGIWLLLWPCWWSSLLASLYRSEFFSFSHLFLFFVGAVALRGAGCTYNDMIDRDLDAAVARTRTRPLPSKRVSLMAAGLFMGMQALVGAMVLFFFNTLTQFLCLCSLGIVALYPFAKRWTSCPQLVLGFAFSWGALVAWTALTARLAWPPLCLYASAVAWTLGYDTIYALQDLRDDEKIGIGSSARLFGTAMRGALLFFYGSAVFFAGWAFILVGVGKLAFLGLVAFALHLLWQIYKVKGASPAQALSLFRSNSTAGLFLFTGLFLDHLGMSPLLSWI